MQGMRLPSLCTYCGFAYEQKIRILCWIVIPVVFLLSRETILEETKTKLVADLNAQALGVS
jgi:hypothetical protein